MDVIRQQNRNSFFGGGIKDAGSFKNKVSAGMVNEPIKLYLGTSRTRALIMQLYRYLEIENIWNYMR